MRLSKKLLKGLYGTNSNFAEVFDEKKGTSTIHYQFSIESEYDDKKFTFPSSLGILVSMLNKIEKLEDRIAVLENKSSSIKSK